MTLGSDVLLSITHPSMATSVPASKDEIGLSTFSSVYSGLPKAERAVLCFCLSPSEAPAVTATLPESQVWKQVLITQLSRTMDYANETTTCR